MGYYNSDTSVSRPSFSYGARDISRDIMGLGKGLESLGGYIEAPDRAEASYKLKKLGLEEDLRQDTMRETVKSLLRQKSSATDTKKRDALSMEAMKYMNVNPEINAILGGDIARDIAARDYARGINKDRVALAQALHGMKMGEANLEETRKLNAVKQTMANLGMLKELGDDYSVDYGVAKEAASQTSGLNPYEQLEAMSKFIPTHTDQRGWFGDLFMGDTTVPETTDFFQKLLNTK